LRLVSLCGLCARKATKTMMTAQSGDKTSILVNEKIFSKQI